VTTRARLPNLFCNCGIGFEAMNAMPLFRSGAAHSGKRLSFRCFEARGRCRENEDCRYRRAISRADLKFIISIFFRMNFDVTSAQRAPENCTAMAGTAQFAVALIAYSI
jgi:hypothetical protein